jgi:hypothetical protein
LLKGGTSQNVACSVGRNPYCDGVKISTGNFGIALITLNARHLGRVMSHRGAVIMVPVDWVLSGVRAYECLPRSGAGPKHLW